MKRLLILFITVIFSLSIISCGKKSEPKTNNQKKLPLIKYKEVVTETFSENFKIIGIVKPYASAKLSSEEGGLITSLRKDKGDRVSRGEVVVKLKKDVDQATYQQSLAQYNLAKDNYERAEKLYKDNVIPERDFANAKLSLDIAERSLDLFKVRLSKGFIVSPINGVVDAKYMNLGEMTGPGVPILSIVDVSRVKISIGIPERYLTTVKKGKTVDIKFDVFPDEEFTGVIDYISPTINPSNRTFEIEVVLNNKDRKLKPEMSANVTVTKETIDDAVVLDQDMIVDNVDEQYVFILENNDTARKKIVKLGGRSGNKVLIEQGLNPGDKLITVGFQSVADGDKVQIGN
jgi:membrane fusion protein, multidrug efflux system